MPIVPTPATQGVAPIGDIQRASGAQNFQNVQQVDMGFGARQLGQLGSLLGDSAAILQGRTNNRLLLEMQAEGNALEEELFNPKTGVRTRLQGDAIGATAEIEGRLAEFKARWQATEGLSASGRDSATKYLEAHRARLTSTVATHETSQSMQYENTLITANVASQIERVALHTDDDTWDAAVANLTTSTDRQIDLLGLEADVVGENGDTPRNTALRENMTQAVISRAAALADNGDATKALEFLEGEKENMTQDAYRKAKKAIETIATEERVDAVSTQAVKLTMIDQGFLEAKLLDLGNVEFAMGDKRPNKPNDALLNILSAATTAVLGDGARVRITSGKENEGEQHGADRHPTGNAADVQFIRKDGSLVKIQSAEGQALIAQLEAAGIKGLGAGDTYDGEPYMGPHTLHADTVRESRWGNYFDNRFADVVGVPRSGSQSSGSRSETTIRLPQGDAPDVDLMSSGMEFILNSGLDADDMASAMASFNNVFAGIERDRQFQIAGIQNGIMERAIEGLSQDENAPLTSFISAQERIALGGDLGTVMAKLENIRLSIDTTDFNWFEENASDVAAYAAKMQEGTPEDQEIFKAEAKMNLSRDAYLAMEDAVVAYRDQQATDIQGAGPKQSDIDAVTGSDAALRAITGAYNLTDLKGEDGALKRDLYETWKVTFGTLVRQSSQDRIKNGDLTPFTEQDIRSLLSMQQNLVGGIEGFSSDVADADTLARALVTVDLAYDGDTERFISDLQDGMVIAGQEVPPKLVQRIVDRYSYDADTEGLTVPPSTLLWEIYRQVDSRTVDRYFVPTMLYDEGITAQQGMLEGQQTPQFFGEVRPTFDAIVGQQPTGDEVRTRGMMTFKNMQNPPSPPATWEDLDTLGQDIREAGLGPQLDFPDPNDNSDVNRDATSAPPTASNTEWFTADLVQNLDLVFDGELITPDQFIRIINSASAGTTYTQEDIDEMYGNYLMMTGKQ